MEVFHALDVGEGAPLTGLLVGDQTAGDARHRAADGHAGVHQSQGGAADGALGGGAVGGQDLGYHADGVGELFHRGDHRQQSLFGQRAVTIFTPGGGPGGPGLAGGEAGEVVVVDITLGLFFKDGVQLLLHGHGSQGADAQDLGLTAGEQAGAVDPGQHAHFRAQGPDLVHGAAVYALAGQQPLFDHLFLHLVQADFDVLVIVLVLFGKLLGKVQTGLVQPGFPDVLVVGVQRILDLVQAVFHQIVQHVIVDSGLFKGELGLADGGDDLVDEGHDLLVGLMGDADALQQDVLGDLVGLGLDHDHLFRGGSDGDEHLAGVALLVGGVDDILPVQVAHVGGSHGPVPGDIGVGHGDERAQGSDHFHGVVIVVGQHGAGDDHVVAQIVVKEGTHGPVDQTGGQDAPLGGAAFPAQIGSGDAAHRVQPLFKVDGQREIVDAGLGLGGGHGGDQNHGVAIAAQTFAVGLLGDLAGLYGKGAAADLGFKDVVVGVLTMGNQVKIPPSFVAAREVQHLKPSPGLSAPGTLSTAKTPARWVSFQSDVVCRTGKRPIRRGLVVTRPSLAEKRRTAPD